ncbi:hypothetical protein [Pedobacter sp. L105]|uniref:hypothetical protein n=1 Tax=Pedobacter sp. L105 TaxID=1641871 RepID=UPI00131CA3C3|nr:hypothetical protein [Pedobacter sp. L105]
MKSILNLTPAPVLLSEVAKGSPAKGTLSAKNILFEVVLEEGITSKPFLALYEKGIDQYDLSDKGKTIIHARSGIDNTYIFELKDQSGALYFSLLLTGYLMDVTVAREFHFEPGDRVRIKISKTDVPNIYDLDFSGLGSAKYRCQNEFLYAKETDMVKVLPEFANDNQHQAGNKPLRYTNLLYDLIEKYQPEMSDYSYHLLHADVLGSLGKYLYSDLQVKLHDQLYKKDLLGFEQLSKNFSDNYKFDFTRNIPDRVLSDSKEYALFMLEKIKTEVLMDFKTVDYHIVYERVKRIYNAVLKDKMIILLFNHYCARFNDNDGEILRDALVVVKNKKYRKILETFN